MCIYMFAMILILKNNFENRCHGLNLKNLFFKDLFFYVYKILSSCTPASQKSAPGRIINVCEPPCGYWDLNSRLLE